jgi:uncharacterized protein involved in outer membrane biogenesis
VVIPQVTVIGPEFNLERNQTGQANWSFGKSGSNSGIPSILPKIEDLRVDNARVAYSDQAANIDMSGRLDQLTGHATDEGVALDGTGSLSDRELKLSLSAGALRKLRAENEVYPVDLQLTLGGTQLSLNGSVDQPLALDGVRADLHLAGSSLADAAVGGLELPETPSYALDGRLTRQGDQWRLEDASAELGESRAIGWAQIDMSSMVPEVRADLLIRELHYGSLVPAGQGKAESAASGDGRVIPDTQLPVSWLDRVNGVVHLKIEQAEVPYVALDAFDVRFTLRDGRIEANPLEIGLAGGTITGELALNGRGDTPSADADLSYEGLRLKRAVRGTRFESETSGTIQGHLYLLGVGSSLRDLMVSLKGHVALVMRDGTFSGLIVEGIELDVLNALALYITKDEPFHLRCAVAGLDVNSGVASTRRFVLDTNPSVVRGQGSIDLAKERLDLRFEGQGKDFSLINPDAPVFIRGTFANPKFSVGRGALIPLIELGLTGDAPCDQLEKEVLSLGAKEQG